MPHPPRLPRLIGLDLDATVWYPEMYHLWGGGGAPFRKQPNGNLLDRGGTEVYLMGNTRAIIRDLKTQPEWQGTQLAYCSCTDEPSWARECLKKFEAADGLSLADAAEHCEIYKGLPPFSLSPPHPHRVRGSLGVPYTPLAIPVTWPGFQERSLGPKSIENTTRRRRFAL